MGLLWWGLVVSALYIHSYHYGIRLDPEKNPEIKKELSVTPARKPGFAWDKRKNFLLPYYEQPEANSPDYKPDPEIVNAYKTQNTTNTVTALHHKLTQDIDDFVQNMYQYGNLYDFIDASYQETHPLHSYLWSSRNKVYVADGVLMLAEYVKHPKLKEMVKKQALRVEKARDVNLFAAKYLNEYIAKYCPEHQKL